MNKYGGDSNGGSMLMVMLAVMMVIRIVVWCKCVGLLRGRS